MTLKGIDISEWQTGIDYKEIKKQGIDFMIPRQGYKTNIDKQFLTHVKGAKEANISIPGVYHFCYAINQNEVIQEAKACIQNIQKAQLGKDLIVFFDFEYDTITKAKSRGVTLSKKECINFTKAFCDYIISQGYKTGIYTNLDYYTNMYDKDTLYKYGNLWLAQYNNGKKPTIQCVFHQYTSSGKVNGYKGVLDMDYYYKTEELLSDGSNVINSNIDFNKYYNKISNSGHDERNRASGGKAGDQTATEWEIRNWYNRPWDCVLRYPDPQVGMLIAELAIEAAYNNLIGYNQSNRDSYWAQLKASGYRPSKITKACDADCSAGVIANTKAVGYLKNIPALKNINATYTGNMKKAFKNAGFQVLTDKKYLTSIDYLLPGDILLNEVHHTATNLGIGKKSNAFSGTSNKVGRNATNESTSEIQRMLNKIGNYGLTVDNDYGPATTAAVIDFQKKNGLEADGIVGTKTLNKLKELTKTSYSGYNKTIKRNGIVTANTLYVRSGPGASYDPIKTIPIIYYNQKVGICDETTAKNGGKWYYVKINNIYGFCSALYIK